MSGQNKNKSFDSKALIEYARENYVALYSVLSKCSFNLDGNELTLFAGNKFYKKKLDDVKYNTHLFDSLKALSYQLTVHIVPTPAPLQSSQAAAVADIMGGGEEVALDAS